jgi:hypothetical protein
MEAAVKIHRPSPTIPITQKYDKIFDFRVKCRAMSLVQLLKQPEGKSLEFKRDLSSPDGALRSIVAFANTAGGALIYRRRGQDEARSRGQRATSDGGAAG